MIAILDYKAGNQTSVLRACRRLGIGACITDESAVLLGADGIIFPGVGAAGQAMERLKSAGQDIVLREAAARGIPILGICLGCQILLERSEENDTETLGILPGVCRRFREDMTDGGERIKIPHMGWNRLEITADSPLLRGVRTGDAVYYVHSYYPDPAEGLALAWTEYGTRFPGAFGRDGLWAVQFHPEKSGPVGLSILRNFSDYCGRAAR